jgi:LacI family transcriptional regulator
LQNSHETRSFSLSRRPTVADLARAADVSVATVDRVREATAERVLGAAEAIGYHATPLIKSRLRPKVPERTFAFLLQREDAFYSQFAGDLSAAARALTQFRARPVIDFAPDLSAAVMAERLKRLGESADAVGVVSVDHPRVSDAIVSLRARGVPTFAILTELGAEAAAPYVGHDNRKEGRTAAWLIAKAARRPGKVGIMSGAIGFSARRRRKSRSAPIFGRTRPNSRCSSRSSISRSRASPMWRRKT